MVEEYLRQIEELLSTSPAVRDVELVRRAVRNTGLEKVLNYRYRITLADGGFVEMTERVVEVHGMFEMTKYRHHWQAGNGALLKRWDNAPHHPAIDTFPHHLHDVERGGTRGGMGEAQGLRDPHAIIPSPCSDSAIAVRATQHRTTRQSENSG
jgi:uncharacterized protein DUF6516